jgi:hypothetical protein
MTSVPIGSMDGIVHPGRAQSHRLNVLIRIGRMT